VIAYLDASALVKLVVRERESNALAAWLEPVETVASSELAAVEVHRAARVANPGPDSSRRAVRVLDSCLLVEVGRDVIELAATLAAVRLRSLDAIHLATALRVRPDRFVAYDERLAEAARAQGFVVAAPA
jgi:predicted nucleic acid-binding protein